MIRPRIIRTELDNGEEKITVMQEVIDIASIEKDIQSADDLALACKLTGLNPFAILKKSGLTLGELIIHTAMGATFRIRKGALVQVKFTRRLAETTYETLDLQNHPILLAGRAIR